MSAHSVGLNDWLIHFFIKGWHHSWNFSVIGLYSFVESSTMRQYKKCSLGNDLGLDCSVYSQANHLRDLYYIFLSSIYPRWITLVWRSFFYWCLILLNCIFVCHSPNIAVLFYTIIQNQSKKKISPPRQKKPQKPCRTLAIL